ncbi:MAG TPA: ATP-binding protein [Burkholderiaceae bacterium]|nr:ATP-binding protein [Burkholderiaceae bacterium]
MPSITSLRTRLLVFLLGLAALAAAVVALGTYRAVLGETDTLFDYHLRQMALLLRDQGATPAEAVAAIDPQPFDYVVQIWSADGAEIYSSHSGPTPLLPPRALLGYSNVEVGRSTWRVYSVVTRSRVIQVGQPVALRRALAASAALRSVTPLLLAAPLVALAVWALVGVSLAPLRPLAALLRTRAPDSLDPLPQAGLPAEVAPLVAALNALLLRLQGAFEAQRAFVADAAHELRSPLTALKLQIDLLGHAGTAPQAVAELTAAMQRAQRLVEQLLALARAEPGGAESARVPTDLAEAARQAMADTVPLAAPRGTRLELDAPEPLQVLGDAQALRVLVRNLVDNAVRYAGAGAQVQVSLRADGQEAVLRVDDSGPGIPPAERERVCARFYRRDGQAEPGSGLGLAIVQAVAQRHGAAVVLAESPLGGLRVEVRLARLGAETSR